MGLNFRDQLVERLLVHFVDIDIPREDAEAFASEVIFLLDKALESRPYEASVRQILQRFAREWSEQNARRVLEQGGDGATEVVYEMIDRQGRSRAVRALRKALLDAVEGRERPRDDMDFFDETQ